MTAPAPFPAVGSYSAPRGATPPSPTSRANPSALGSTVSAGLRGRRNRRMEAIVEYNRLGRSSMSVSKICLGTMHFGPKADEAESHAILDRAARAGHHLHRHRQRVRRRAGSGPLGGDHRHVVRRPARRSVTRSCWRPRCTRRWSDLGRPTRTRGFSAYKVRQASRRTPCVGCRPTGSTSTKSTTSTGRVIRRGVLGNLRARRGRRGRALRRFEQLLRLGSGQAAAAGLAARLRRLRLRADPVQPAQPGARDGGATSGPGLRHRR